jgi:hypothetical protein
MTMSPVVGCHTTRPEVRIAGSRRINAVAVAFRALLLALGGVSRAGAERASPERPDELSPHLRRDVGYLPRPITPSREVDWLRTGTGW